MGKVEELLPGPSDFRGECGFSLLFLLVFVFPDVVVVVVGELTLRGDLQAVGDSVGVVGPVPVFAVGFFFFGRVLTLCCPPEGDPDPEPVPDAEPAEFLFRLRVGMVVERVKMAGCLLNGEEPPENDMAEVGFYYL